MGFLTNEQGQLLGAKVGLVLAVVLVAAWCIRDCGNGTPLTDHHVILLIGLLAVGLVNRMSARGQFRLKIGKDGGELECHDTDANCGDK